ncbi:protein YgfX [Nitrosomonas aestuarii]|nr:protein YgfX [Nitrosomonas aestuarii]
MSIVRFAANHFIAAYYTITVMSKLTIHLKSSKQLAAILLVMHCAAALILCFLTVSINVKWVGLLLLIVSLCFYFGHTVRLSFANSAVLLKFSDKADCELYTASGRVIDCTVLSSTFVSSYLTVLILQPAHCWLTRSVIIMSDTVDAEEFRRLRVLLRWQWKQTYE